MAIPYQLLKKLSQGPNAVLHSAVGFNDKQFQPASLDLTLGTRVYRVSSSFLPRENETVEELLKKQTLYDFELRPGSILETNTTYVIPLNESLTLPSTMYGVVSPKSSIGRIDVFVRVVTDRNTRYDEIPSGYHGPLYIEIIPLTFALRVAPGLPVTQLRLRGDNEVVPTPEQLLSAHHNEGILFNRNGEKLPPEKLGIKDNTVCVSVDLTNSEIIGYRARHYVNSLLDLTAIGTHEVKQFWTKIERHPEGELILEPNSFYILATKERIRIPADFAAEIAPYDPSTGELRSHYAGFIDPGWGYGKTHGTVIVLEVRAHSAPFRLTDGQAICKMVFERITERPERLYGNDLRSNYENQDIKLSKFFKDIT